MNNLLFGAKNKSLKIIRIDTPLKEILNFNELDTDNIKSYGLHISEYETD